MGRPRRSKANDELQDELRREIAERDPVRKLSELLDTPWILEGDIVQLDSGVVDTNAAKARIAENDAKCKHEMNLIHKVCSNLRHRPAQVVDSTTTHIVKQDDEALLKKMGLSFDDLYSDDQEFAPVGDSETH